MISPVDLGPVDAAASYRALYPRLFTLAMAIQTHEGFYPGSAAFRNNNPGNLRSSPLQNGNAFGLSTFPDYFTGLVALLRDLWGKCSGHSSTGLDGKATLRTLITIWAPPNENDTEAYVNAVCAETGFSPSMLLRELLG